MIYNPPPEVSVQANEPVESTTDSQPFGGGPAHNYPDCQPLEGAPGNAANDGCTCIFVLDADQLQAS